MKCRVGRKRNSMPTTSKAIESVRRDCIPIGQGKNSASTTLKAIRRWSMRSITMTTTGRRSNRSRLEGMGVRTTAFFYDKDTKVSEVMGLETCLKGNIGLLPYINQYGVSQYIPTQIVTSQGRQGSLRVSRFYYSYIN